MKPIRRNKNFEKNFKKRIGSNKKMRKQFEARLQLFITGNRGAPLNDHALIGTMKDKHSFSVSGDIRIIYTEDDDCYRFLDIGTHAQVYDM